MSTAVKSSYFFISVFSGITIANSWTSLQNCLDVLAFETSNYASILKPVVLQLINQHYSDCDDATSDQGESSLTELEKDLKKTIYTIFQQKYEIFDTYSRLQLT